MVANVTANVTANITEGRELLDPFFSFVGEVGECDALRLLEQCRRRCDAAEASVLAGRIGGGDEGGAKRLLRLAGVSRRDSGRRVDRARVVGVNPAVGELLAAGAVSGEQVDVIATADRHTDGEASVDAGFVHEVLDASPDAGSAVRKQWMNDRLSAADATEKHRRQRTGRHAWRHHTDAGLAAITVAGDDATVDRLWARIGVAADRGYHCDGGRAVKKQDHLRSYPQRLFDAFAHLVDGKGGSGSRRPSVVITVDAQRLLDPNDGRLVGEQIGTGPIADEVIVEALKTADLWTLVAEPTGQPLWLARSRRDASLAQLIAMICRDKGCVETGEHWTRTDAHHLVGWNATAQGRTDVDKMALVSETVHRDIHATGETFEYDATIGKWRRRKAELHEQSPRWKARDRRPAP